MLCYVTAVVLNAAWLTLGDALSTNYQMIVPLLTLALVAVGVLLRLGDLSDIRRKTYCRRALWVLFIYYLTILSALLFFGGLFHLDRAWGGAVNLEPFYTIRRFWIHYRRTGSLASLSNLLGNVMILVPLGVLLPVLFRPMRRIWLFVPLLALICVGVEWLQWYSGLGIADVDDSILNFAGALVGWIVTRLCQLIYYWVKGAGR